MNLISFSIAHQLSSCCWVTLDLGHLALDYPKGNQKKRETTIVFSPYLSFHFSISIIWISLFMNEQAKVMMIGRGIVRGCHVLVFLFSFLYIF